MQQRPTPRATPLKRGEDTDSSLQSHIPGTGASVWGNRGICGGREEDTHTVVGNDSHGVYTDHSHCHGFQRCVYVTAAESITFQVGEARVVMGMTLPNRGIRSRCCLSGSCCGDDRCR